jgi:hypothetical protein
MGSQSLLSDLFSVSCQKNRHGSRCEQHPSCENPIDGIHITAPNKTEQ